MSRPYAPRSVLFACVMIFALVLASCTGDDNGDNGDSGEDGASSLDRPIVFADLDWASPLLHNRVAQFILEEGYGYETDTISGTTNPMFQGMVQGEIDINMEVQVEVMPTYQDELDDGSIAELGVLYRDAAAGWYVPTYMIEGDPERGIEPITPDLRSVEDLPEHKEAFQDPEDPSKGRIYIGVPGWQLTEINEAKLQAYELTDDFNGFLPGSAAAMMTSLVTAYELGEGWIGHLWTPHWIVAQLDLTRIEEPEYTDECWETIYEGDVACAFEDYSPVIVANADFAEQAPDVVEFLENYESTVDQTNAALLYMQENDVLEDEAALWYLREYEDVWATWVSDDIAEKVKDALSTAGES